MNNSITLNQARTLINPSVEALRSSCSQAVDEWNRASPVMHAALRSSARAHVLNNLIYHFAAQNLDGVVFGEEKFQRYMRFGDFLVVRVKLFDAAMRTRNYPTRQAKRWIGQNPLPNFPVGRLHFGYRLDPTASALQDAFITLPTGNRFSPNEWVWQIMGESIEAFPVRTNFFGDEIFRSEVA